MSKVYRPSVRYDARFKDYVDRIKEVSGLDGAQIIRLALFVSVNSPQFAAKLKEQGNADMKMPMPKWDKRDDNMWLQQQGDDSPVRLARVVAGASGAITEPTPQPEGV